MCFTLAKEKNKNSMKHLSQFVTLLIVAALLSCSDNKTSKIEQNHTISGEVFITTRGGDTIKISGVDISFYARDAVQNAYDEALRAAPADIPDYDERIATWSKLASDFDRLKGEFSGHKRDEMIEQARSSWEHVQNIKNAQAEWPHASYIFTFFPEAEHQTITDSEGRFSISLPSGDWIAVAESRRSLGRNEERYYWALPAKSGKPLLMTNQNMVTASSPDSAINVSIGYFKHE
jgi:hypothetical protein